MSVGRKRRRLIINVNSLLMERFRDGVVGVYNGKSEVATESKHFDWIGKDPQGSVLEWIGTYKLNGDTLTLCFRFSADGSAKRPKTFSTRDWVRRTPMAFYGFQKK
jgi:uncharacterized protein (TIGR03067 family)